MKIKVLILGSTGMIGHQVYNYLNNMNTYELSNISFRKKLNSDTILKNARNETEITQAIKNIDPDYVVNCIGVLIRGSNDDLENAIFVNAYLPHLLKRICTSINAVLIHMSTDCVFSGQKQGPYNEMDQKDGVGNYAITKALGEIDCDEHLTIRTSVVGPELKNSGEALFHWFMNQSDSINGYTKSIWSGVTTYELAKVIDIAINKNITGLHHITNGRPITKYELLNLFKKYTMKDITIIPLSAQHIDKSFRDNRGDLKHTIPIYENMIKEMMDQIINNPDLYTQYTIGK